MQVWPLFGFLFVKVFMSTSGGDVCFTSGNVNSFLDFAVGSCDACALQGDTGEPGLPGYSVSVCCMCHTFWLQNASASFCRGTHLREMSPKIGYNATSSHCLHFIFCPAKYACSHKLGVTNMQLQRRDHRGHASMLPRFENKTHVNKNI